MAADDTSREALIESLRGPLANVLCNADNFPRRAQPHVLGADMGPLMDATAEAVVDAVVMPLVQERDRLQRGARTLGETLDKQLRDVLDITGRHDCIDEDGDGDWGAVWDSLYSMKANLDAAIKRAEAAEAAHKALTEAVLYYAASYEDFPNKTVTERLIAPTLRQVGKDLRHILDERGAPE